MTHYQKVNIKISLKYGIKKKAILQIELKYNNEQIGELA